MKRTDKILIVGAGVSGAAAARALTDNGYNVHVIDKAYHIAGNCYDYPFEFAGENRPAYIQPYGPHIFHTNSRRIFDFLGRFTEWNTYEHKVRAKLSEEVSIGMTINAMELAQQLIREFLDINMSPADIREALRNVSSELGSADVSIRQLQSSKSPLGNLIGTVLWAKVYEPYTKRQWGTSEVDESILDRVKINLLTWEQPTYFKDEFQAQPKNGFTSMVKRMLEGIHVSLDTPFTPDMIKDYDLVLCTAAIDDVVKDFLNANPGIDDPMTAVPSHPLEYRTMLFDIQVEYCLPSHYPKFRFGNATYNDASSYYVSENHFHKTRYAGMLKPPLRYTSFRTLNGMKVTKDSQDVYCLEYPVKWEPGLERHYPIPGRVSRDSYELYASAAEKLMPTVKFFGRLGSYQYLNIDQAVANGLKVAESIIEGN